MLPAFAIAGFTFATAAVPLTAEAVAAAGGADATAALLAGYRLAFALTAALLAAGALVTLGLLRRPARASRPATAP